MLYVIPFICTPIYLYIIIFIFSISIFCIADVNNGKVTGEGAIAIKLECRNGRIHIEAKDKLV